MATRKTRQAASGGSQPNAVYSARGRARRIGQGGEPIGGTLGPAGGQSLRELLEMGVYETKLAAIEAAIIRERDRQRRRLDKADDS